MSAGTLFVLYGLFLEIVATVALTNPNRWSSRGREEQKSVRAGIFLNLCVLWAAIVCQSCGLLIPALRSAWVSPISTWLVLTGLVCLMSFCIYLACTPGMQSARAAVQAWFWGNRRKDTSGVPGEIARQLQKKTKLARFPHETDLDYINRCRDHIVRKLNAGER